MLVFDDFCKSLHGGVCIGVLNKRLLKATTIRWKASAVVDGLAGDERLRFTNKQLLDFGQPSHGHLNRIVRFRFLHLLSHTAEFLHHVTGNVLMQQHSPVGSIVDFRDIGEQA